MSALFLNRNGTASTPWIEKAVYSYTDEKGETLFQAVRKERTGADGKRQKNFPQRRPDGHGGWIPNLDGARRVPYRLHELVASKDPLVLVCEGEKDADTARALGFTATCNPGGAGKWRDEYSEHIRGKIVSITAHADEPGRKHAQQVAASLADKAASLKIIEGPSAKDLTEFVEHGGTRDALLAFIANAPDWKPPASATDDWLQMFDTPEEIENAPPLTFAIEGFLQCEAATLIAGLSGDFKTWLALCIVKALLDESEMLWDTFAIRAKAKRVVYLIPESARGPFRHRLQILGLMPYVRDRRLLVRTLSKGPAPFLQDPRILKAAEGADVFLDTAVRFMQGDENSASDNARGLAADVFALLGVARLNTAIAHSPKSFSKDTYMELENMVRGSGDIGACFANGWGLRQLPESIVHIQNIKPRDFDPCGPFQLAARPHLSERGDFKIWRRPNECGPLSEYLNAPGQNRGGASPEKRENKAANLELLRAWIREDPNQTSDQLAKRFKDIGIDVSATTVRRYKQQVDQKATEEE